MNVTAEVAGALKAYSDNIARFGRGNGLSLAGDTIKAFVLRAAMVCLAAQRVGLFL